MSFIEENKAQIAKLIAESEKKGFIYLGKVTELTGEDNEDVIDEVIEFFENNNIQVLRSDEEIELETNTKIDDIDIEYDESLEDEPDDEDIAIEEEMEIKESDFDAVDNSPYQSDDIVRMYLHEMGQIPLLNFNQEVELAHDIQDGIVAKEKLAHYKKTGKELSKEEEKELNYLVERGQLAKNDLVEANMRLVVSVAKRYVNRGLTLADLIQEGSFGLMKAADKFDPTKGYKFSTYATWWIRQTIVRSIADKGRNVRIPVHMHESINHLAKCKRRLVQELHREPTIEEIAAEMKLSVEKVIDLERVAQDSISLDNSIGDEDDSTLNDLVADENTLNPSQYTDSQLFKGVIDEILSSLTPREEKVIRLRFGIGVDKVYTLEEVGEELNITRERVRQIETKALNRLKKHDRFNKIREYASDDNE